MLNISSSRFFAPTARIWRVGALLAASALAYGDGAHSWSPACDETRSGRYTFEKLGGSPERPVRISVCPDGKCASKSDFATVTDDSWSAPRPTGMARPYFLIERKENGATESRIIGARHLALEGAYNFRDLGGIRATDGKTVRWGQVFRSDTLTHLTAADYQRLNSIGISLVCDLRTREERQTDPTEWKSGSPLFLLAPVSEDDKGGSQNESIADLMSGKVSIEQGRAMFEAFYVHMVFDSAPKFGAVLRAIETIDRPAMFHCTGGRDRTGITAALLLHMLGVPKETIVSDFLLSTRYLDENPAAIPFPPEVAGTERARNFIEIIRLQPRYIDALFNAIDQRYGSFDRYRRDALHFSDADVAAVRARLLE